MLNTSRCFNHVQFLPALASFSRRSRSERRWSLQTSEEEFPTPSIPLSSMILPSMPLRQQSRSQQQLAPQELPVPFDDQLHHLPVQLLRVKLSRTTRGNPDHGLDSTRFCCKASIPVYTHPHTLHAHPPRADSVHSSSPCSPHFGSYPLHSADTLGYTAPSQTMFPAHSSSPRLPLPISST